ncbi:uncharacterized protein TM35_000082520 [Trypanosoma theileri]|uniref:Uncharacterized protein n=1 Tax=Trypanosoma theileri TaxID=67003 RepID=A0A1X0P0J0_9TRYP|nr:uncharacterized protein TM35_000082520 [Trypanosoma theileri]ORC90454.1 hypothetical protein TM35_000082520 [Trypanosoma theileri]
MNTVNGMEFDLLRSMQLSSLKDDNQLTREEKQTLAEQRHREIDEAQYVAHRLQDRVGRIREQFAIRGRASKPNSYTRDADKMYGLFWFGKGKYEDDILDARDDEDQQEDQRELINDISEADDIPDEERFKVWRPIVGPPRPRGCPNSVSPVPANEDQHSYFNNRDPLLYETAPIPKKKKTALTPPWAEHYDVERNANPNYGNRAEHNYELFKRGILPRGENGIDDILRYARSAQDLVLSLQDLRLREDRRREQCMLKTALDEQLLDKRRRRLAQYEEELVHIYGPTMQHILTDTFQEPLSEQLPMIEVASSDDEEKKEEREHLQREKVPQRRFREREETSETRAKQSRQAWLAAWEDHKRNLASTSTPTPTTDAVSSKWSRYHMLGAPSTPSMMQNRPSALSPSVNSLKMEQHVHYRQQQYRDELNRKRGEHIIGLNKSN